MALTWLRSVPQRLIRTSQVGSFRVWQEKNQKRLAKGVKVVEAFCSRRIADRPSQQWTDYSGQVIARLFGIDLNCYPDGFAQFGQAIQLLLVDRS